METDQAADVVVVGAGVVGLACAAALLRHGRTVLVLEQHAAAGRETSSRNSEVIHAGLYYPRGSLKAESCVEGRERLYERCRSRGIPHRRTGKLVVATDAAEVAELERIANRARANGAGAIELIDAAELKRREPRVRAQAALSSPESGIVDVHALMASYQAEIEAAGGAIVTHTRVLGLSLGTAQLWQVETEADTGERYVLTSSVVINSAGLEADRIAALAGLDVDALGYRLHLCKGDYFSLAPGLGRICEHLIYPVPVQGGLGIHVTLDLGGRYRLGPDVTWIEERSYAVDPAKAELFAMAVQPFLPEIRPEHLSPDFAGLRPKLQAPDEPFRDFVLEEESEHGAPGLISLLGIESPGLTAAEALAERVVELVG